MNYEALQRISEAGVLRLAASVLTRIGYRETAHFVRAVAQEHESGEAAPAMRPDQLTRLVPIDKGCTA